MKIGLRGGHSKNCIGAVGIVNEYDQMQLYFNAVKKVLEAYGHVVVDCNSNGSTADAELSEGANKSNNANVDLFVSLHMNASDGQGHGVEAWISSQTSGSYKYALNMVNNLSALGFTNRGVQYRSFYEMNHIKAPNVIFELCFCDSPTDISIYNKYTWEQLAYRLANAIDPNIPIEPPTDQKGYVVTNYLKPDSATYDGININRALEPFKGVTCYVRGNSKGVWIETQYLPLDQCNQLRNALGSVFYEIKK